MLKPLYRYVIWLALALWFAMGIGGVRAPVEREVYGQVRKLAQLSFDITPEKHLASASTVRPGAAVVALPFYGIGRLVGLLRVDNPADPDSLCAQTTKLAASFAMATGLALLYLSGVVLGIRRGACVLAILLAGFASPLTLYGAQLAPPAFGLFAVACVLYPLLRFRQKDKRLRMRVMLGLGLGLLVMSGDVLLLMAPVFIIWAVLAVRNLWQSTAPIWPMLVVFGALLVLAAMINAASFGGALNAPDGLSLGSHLWHVYAAPAGENQGYAWVRLFSGLKMWLVGNGPIASHQVALQQWPAALAGKTFLGVLVWFPPLALGMLGAFAKKRDGSTRGALRILGAGFWLLLVSAAVARSGPDATWPDAGATIPLWAAYLLGLAFFIEYHLWKMHGLIWKNLLRVLFILGFVAAWGNGWYGLAARNVGPPLSVIKHSIGLAAKTLPPNLGVTPKRGLSLPASRDDAFFMNANRTAEWMRNKPKSFWATFRPGLNNLVMFAAILIFISFVPLLLLWIGASTPRRELDGDYDEAEHLAQLHADAPDNPDQD